jgi:hypothetical protein
MIRELVRYIQETPDWKESIVRAPYCVTVKQHPDHPTLYLFSYNHILSDFSIPLVKAARGCVLDIGEAGVTPVCVPFYKFHNYGEPCADPIDWQSARLFEKIDGSLIKLYYNPHSQKMEFCTNGSFNIDCSFVPSIDGWIAESETTFKTLIDEALKKYNITFKSTESISEVTEFGKCQMKDFTYLFELISPQNRIIVPYTETDLVLLGARRNSGDYQEISAQEAHGLLVESGAFPVSKPIDLPNPSQERVLAYVAGLGKNHEGVVVCDSAWKRVKVKCEEYVRLHALKGNGFTEKALWTAMMEGSIDDILGNFPEYKDFYAKKIRGPLDKICGKLVELAMECGQHFPDTGDAKADKKSYAMWVRSVPQVFQNWCFYLSKKGVLRESEEYFRGAEFQVLLLEYLVAGQLHPFESFLEMRSTLASDKADNMSL